MAGFHLKPFAPIALVGWFWLVDNLSIQSFMPISFLSHLTATAEHMPIISSRPILRIHSRRQPHKRPSSPRPLPSSLRCCCRCLPIPITLILMWPN